MKKFCVNCINYDGEFCTKDINNLDYSSTPFLAEFRKSPHDSCNDFEENYDGEDGEIE